jgi:lactate dehydrogenase-like 2-hydroxyacid dehydrogenase
VLLLLGGPDILDKVLERSDYVVVSMPASPETVGWIGETQLRLRKPSAFLINVARAEIVDEEALYQALARRELSAANQELATDTAAFERCRQPVNRLRSLMADCDAAERDLEDKRQQFLSTAIGSGWVPTVCRRDRRRSLWGPGCA